MLNDSGIFIEDDFLKSFINESSEVLKDLSHFLSCFESVEDTFLFENYGQQIDRIMGAAYTLSLNSIGDLARAGKELGYKGSQVSDISKLLVIQSLLGQLVKALEDNVKLLKKDQRPDPGNYSVLLHRLTTASNQLGDLRTTVKVKDV